MSEFTYQTRWQINQTWIATINAKGNHLSESERELLPLLYHEPTSNICRTIQKLLQSGEYETLSDLYRTRFQSLVDIGVKKEWQEDFYYALDEMNCYQMSAGWFRRSLRSNSYAPFARQSIELLQAYAKLDFYGGELVDILTGNVTPEIYDHARTEPFHYAGILAAQIDREEEKTIRAVKDILFGENNTMMMSRELVLGIVMSKSQELYEDLGKFLLAARLQEGARQAVCEAMDAGRPEAFLYLFSVIEENNLIRFSSVKRAVSTWIGIFNENGVERVSEKLLRLMGKCIRDEAFAKEQFATNDAVAISCALWAKGFYNAADAVETVLSLIKTGTKQQKMTASYFTLSLQDSKLQMQISKEILRSYSDDLSLAACFMPSFMSLTEFYFYELLRDEHEYTYNFHAKAIRKPKHLAAEAFFESKEEAEEFYFILKEMMKQVPKKGLTFSPCIFPWHQVTLTQSDIAVRLCLIAWILQKDALLDEAAELIPLIGSGEGHSAYNSLRVVVTITLLYEPVSPVKKKVLFELLHNPENYTNRAAHQLIEKATLSPEDYLEIEKNLKYKKGRAKTLALLRKQDNKSLTACIARLLAEKSEECHMGALDLAMQLKKEDAETFAEILPNLRALSNPSGKEQMLLKELLGTESEAQDILNTPGYGLYDITKDWSLPQVNINADSASKLFVYGEDACIHVIQKLDKLIDENRELSYFSSEDGDLLLGCALARIRSIYNNPEIAPLDEYPFREMWEAFYEEEIKSPELLIETELYCCCCQDRDYYETNIELYKKVFGSGASKEPPFSNLFPALTYERQVHTVLSALFKQYVSPSLAARFGICGIAGLLSSMNDTDDYFFPRLFPQSMATSSYVKRVTSLPIFSNMCRWLSHADGKEWENAFTLRFQLQLYYQEQERKKAEAGQPFNKNHRNYLELSDYVQCYVRGIWDKDLFYKAIFTFEDIGNLLVPISIIAQKGTLSSRDVKSYELRCFLGDTVIKAINGKYCFDKLDDKIPEIAFAHELYEELISLILKVELKRAEQPTPFSQYIKKIRVIYGIDNMIQLLTALGKEPLQRGYRYYYQPDNVEKKPILSHLLKVSMPLPEENAADLKKALKGSEITEKRLIELAMYAPQWIPMMEEYLEMPGFTSACYYFLAHTSEYYGEQLISMVTKYTPLSQEELRNGAFDIHWFFEAYEKLGEKNFKLLYDAAKYSSDNAAHARARKYADAALGKVDKNTLKAQINAKRNKDLLMSIALLPLPKAKKAREEELLDRYQFIQQYKKESRQFGAQRRTSEECAAETALCNLSLTAGFTDTMRLILRMEGQLFKQSEQYFNWFSVDDIELMISIDENGKSVLNCRKDAKLLKSVPTKYKKNETVLQLQKTVKKLKEQYSRTRQMMEQAMEDRTDFEVWEFLELFQNPVTRPITEPLVVKTSEEENAKLGFLTKDGIMDISGALLPVKPEDKIIIAHPFDFYQHGCLHDYQKMLFEKQIKQPFKQVFRELYVKLDEELEKSKSMLFAGNQIQARKAVSVLKSRRWLPDFHNSLQKIYYKENIVVSLYAMADWFTLADIEEPTLEYVLFTGREMGNLKIKDIPDVLYSEVMRDVDLAVSVAHAGGVDPETSHSTIEMRKAIVEGNLSLFRIKNVRLQGNHAIIDGKLGQYTVHLGSGIVHQMGNTMLSVVPVHSQRRGRIFLPFVDDDPKTAEIMSKILLFAEDGKMKDPNILRQIR